MTSLAMQDRILIGMMIAMVGMAAFVGLLNVIIYLEKWREQQKLEDAQLLVGVEPHPLTGAWAEKSWMPGVPLPGCEPSGRWATGTYPVPQAPA